MILQKSPLVQNGARQLVRYRESQCPSYIEGYLHESEKSSQQKFCGQTSTGSSLSKCCIRGKRFLKKKGEKASLFTQMTCNNCHLDSFLIKCNKFTQLCRGLKKCTAFWKRLTYPQVLASCSTSPETGRQSDRRA